MHEEPSTSESSSRRDGYSWGWVCAVVVALPPIWELTSAPRGARGAAAHEPPAWLLVYTLPYIWLVENTPLREFLGKYADWWSWRMR